ncbi:hypothetical protein [Rubrivirga litoralis]|uniref:HNH endonuclease n=1 Tax=Rubrivirga litoralis TaxID=3075598 RepID=A0ABU3BNM7_9BACT|nr:hypothetical protein [Rubrivirga sp. F394]MDT0630892.1 hypothetical protein [Rubrivirga sp. F394]
MTRRSAAPLQTASPEAASPAPGRFFLCSYWPLVKTLGGRRAVEAYGLPPYANGMSRREPDFEHARPALTSSSRGRGFVPRLSVGDAVVFTTTKGRWGGGAGAHWRLVAVLEVTDRFGTHAEAAAWYQAAGLRPPGNLVVDGNPPLPAPLTLHHGRVHDGGWDAVCRERAAACGVVLACRTRLLGLYDPPAVTQDDWLAVFGGVPNTRTPPQISEAQFDRLLALTDARRAAPARPPRPARRAA